MTSFRLKCAHCGAAFEAVNNYAKFCSPRCRMAASRSRARVRLLLETAAFFGTDDLRSVGRDRPARRRVANRPRR